MKFKPIFFASAAAALILIFILSFISDNPVANKDVEEVTTLVETAYINGAFNDLNTQAMRSGFHPDFAIFSASGEEIDKYPIDTWIKAIEQRKLKPDFDPATQKYEHQFKLVDVTSGSAAVKVELYQDQEHIYTDYLSLLKFESGWKIVAKVYHYHKQ